MPERHPIFFPFFEHARATWPRLAGFQDGIAPRWNRACGGCNPNRDTMDTLGAAGFTVDRLWTSKPGVLVQGQARAAG
jgi:hypothetical protein